MLAAIRPSTPTSTPTAHLSHAEIRAVSFSAATIRTGRVVVAKIDCTGVRPQDIACESARPGFVAEVLPTRTRQGRFVILAVRVHRQLGTPRGLCLLRFTAGPASSLGSLTVLS